MLYAGFTYITSLKHQKSDVAVCNVLVLFNCRYPTNFKSITLTNSMLVSLMHISRNVRMVKHTNTQIRIERGLVSALT